MKLVRFGQPGRERPGVLSLAGDTIVDVSEAIDDYDRGFWENGGFDQIAALDLSQLPTVPVDSVRLGPPIARPEKIVCIGLNYRDHAEEIGIPPPAEPIVFMKAPNTLVGPNDDVLIPPGSTKTDWEIELAVIIGRRARYLPDQTQVGDIIGGYTIANDVSEREYQLERGGQWVKGKSAETFNPLGPYLVSPGEIPNPGGLAVSLAVNGEVLQDSSTANLIFDVPYLVWYLSQFMVLEPGDIINTGTPSGTALGLDPPRYLRPGDTMDLSIDLLGVQQLTCRAGRR